MAGDVRDLTIGLTWNVNNSALKQADEATSQLIHKAEQVEKQMRINPAGLEKGAAGLRKLSETAGSSAAKLKELSNVGRTTGSGIEAGMIRADAAMSKVNGASTRLRSSLKETGAAGKTIGEGVATGVNRATESINREVSMLDRLKSKLSSLKSATAGAFSGGSGGGVSKFNTQLEQTEKKASKLKETLKETAAAFSVGMLAAGAVQSVVDGGKELIGGGYERLKERESGQAMWATSISDAHGTSGKSLTRASEAANDSTMVTALQAGNSYEMANGFAKQIYSSDAGSRYSGNVSGTQRLLKGIFNIQDANALSDREMEMMKMAVGNIGDLGKMTGQSARSFNLLDGKITRAIRKEYKKETGHDLGLNKTGTGYDWSAVDAATAYRGLDAYGNSRGVGKASERFNSTLPGAMRSVREGTLNWLSEVMKKSGEQIAKGGGFSDILGKISKTFTSKDLMSNADKFASKLTGVANALGQGIKAVSPFVKAFGEGFIGGLKSVINNVKNGIDKFKDIAKSALDMLPKGTGNKVSDWVKDAAKFAGAMTAIGLSIKGFTKLPLIGKPLQGILNFVGRLTKLDKIPGIKSLFSGAKGNNGALSANTGALNRLTAALGGKNKGGKNGTGDDYNDDYGDEGKNGKGKDRLTRKNRKYNKAASKYERAVEKYGYGSKQANKARSRMERFEDKAATKLERTGARYGTHSSKYQRALRQANGIAERYGNTEYAGRVAAEERNWSRSARYAKQGTRMSRLFGGIGRVAKAGGGGLMRGIAGAGSGLMRGLGGVGRFASLGGSGLARGIGAVGRGAKGLFSAGRGALSAVAESGAGRFVRGAVGRAGGVLSLGMTAMDVYSAMQQKPGKARNKAVGSAIGSGVGGVAGAALGSFLGPLGTIAGGAAGSWLGGKAGSFIGKNAGNIGKTVSGMGKAVTGAAKGAGKWFGGVYDGAKSGLSKAGKAVSSGASHIGKSMKSGLSKAGKVGSNVFKGVSNAVKSGMSKASSATKSGAKKVQNAFKNAFKFKSSKSGFNKINRDAKSGMSKVTKTVKSGSKKTQKAGKDAFKFKSSKSGFNKLNRTAKSGMNKVTKTVKSGSKKVQRSGKDAFKFKSSKSGFNKLNSTAKSGMVRVARTVKSGAKKVQNAGRNIFKFKSSKSGFNQLVGTAKSGMNRVASAVKSGAHKIQNSAKDAFRFKSAAAGFNQLNSQAKSGMSRVESTIKSSASKWESAIKSGLTKAAATMTSVFSKMASTATSKSSAISSALEKVGSTASSVASKISSLQSAIDKLKSKTITLTVDLKGKGAGKLANGTPGAKQAFSSVVPRYAGGTPHGGHTGGLALVNDAKGSTFREAFMLPNGLVGLFPNKRNITVPLPVGTHVLDAATTRKKFGHAYAKGTSGAKEAFKTLTNTAGNAVPKTEASPKQSTVISINPNMSFTFNGGVNSGEVEKIVMQLLNTHMSALAHQLGSALGLELA